MKQTVVKEKTKRSIKKFEDLRGPEKAAAFLLSVKEESAGKILQQLEEFEIKELSQIMSNLGVIPSEVTEELLKDFMTKISSTGSSVGSFESTENLLLKTLSRDQVNSIMEDIRGPSGRTMWEKLANVSEDFLANYLKNEYPQTAAVILAKIKPEQAARVKEK